MKVIANVSSSKLLVEIGKEELAKVLGYSYASYAERANKNIFEVGAEIDIDERYRTINALGALPETVANVKKRLEDALSDVEKATKAVEQTTFEPVRKTKN